MTLLPKNFADLITFTRSSTATRVNAAGQIETVPADTPRFDHDPVTGELKGLLIEEARTNLLLRSEEFDNASWAISEATVTASPTNAPDGAATADKLVEASGSITSMQLRQIVSFTSGVTYTLTVFAKYDGRRWLIIRAGNTGVLGIRSYFDLQNGELGDVQVGSASIEDVGDGWYRCIATGVAGTTASTNVIFSLSDTDGTLAYTGDGTSGIYLWGAQLEEGSFATSYIPTTTATATRAADNASITGTAFSDWYNASEGTLYVEGSVFPDVAEIGSNRIAQFDDNTANERLTVYAVSSGVSALVTDGGASQAIINSGVLADSNFKAAFGFKVNDFALSVNGGAVGTDTSGTIPTVDRLRLGNRDGGGSPWNGHIKNLRFYPTRLSNTELQELTA